MCFGLFFFITFIQTIKEAEEMTRLSKKIMEGTDNGNNKRQNEGN